MSTASDLLAQVESQITLRMGGAEEIQYPDGSRVRLPSLATLEALRKQYRDEAAAEAAGSSGGLYRRTATRSPS